MKSQRLEAIASLIEKNDQVIDIGCDHAYLSIYLCKNKLCKKVMATDINENPLRQAQKNIEQNGLNIELKLSDGLEDIEIGDFDTLVIAGMGTTTIKKILSNDQVKKIKKLVLASHNDLVDLRYFVTSLGFYLQKELVVYENGKYYEIMAFRKNDKKNTEEELIYGLLDTKYCDYYAFLIDKYTKIYCSLPEGERVKKDEYQRKIDYLQNFIGKI